MRVKIDLTASLAAAEGEGGKRDGDALTAAAAADEMPGMPMENGVREAREGADVVKAVDSQMPNGAPASAVVNGVAPPDQTRIAIEGSDGMPPQSSLVNGNDLKMSEAPSTDGAMDVRSESPPYIKPVGSGQYKDLSELTARLVQETFNELAEVIHAMADMTLSPNNAHGPGYGQGNAATNGSSHAQIAIQKKSRLMDFVQLRRAQFIKLLVLAQWSRQTEDVSQAINLLQWLRTQAMMNEEACLELGRLKLSLGPAKLPNPDLATALEVLSTGKASWLPDLGYIPPQPLSAKEMLKTLRNINTLLSIRLNLHDELPPHFSSFTIDSGRATFHVPDEFEVDLSIADEDPASQLYFIDIRFLFTPFDPDVLKGRLRDEIEAKANDVLKRDGLGGCYDFLHELVLTHKINALRRQAEEMSRGKWAESIRLEMVRRTLVVQYWLNRPGGKSWIEIGIRSGGKKFGRGGSTQRTSAIAIWWRREGKEVKDAAIELQLARLSMDGILKHVIALHTNHILRSIRDRLLEKPLYANRTLLLVLRMSTVEPVHSSLQLQLTSSRTAKLVIESVGGRFALQPASLRFSQTEHVLNGLKDPAAEAYGHLSNLRCLVAKEEIETRARCVGWEQLRTLAPRQEDMKRVFPRETLQVSYFVRRGWSSRWIVAVSVGMGGEDWWIIELLVDGHDRRGLDTDHGSLPAAVGHAFGDHQRIPVGPGSSKPVDPTYDFLCRLGKVSAGMILQYVNVRALGQARVEHSLRAARPSPGSGKVAMPALFIRFSSLMAHGSRRRLQAWAREVLKVTFRGVASSSGVATVVTEARLIQPRLFNAVHERVDDDIAFQPDTGAFAFRIRTPVGEPIVNHLRERLVRIERLILFLRVVRRFQLPCERLSLGRVTFRYSTTPPLRATVGFAGETPMTLELEAGNPHLRIADFLARLLNAKGTDANGLEHVALLLGVTLPLFQALDEIEASAAAATPARNVLILPRAADWLQLRYEAPRAVFDIRLRQRRDEVKWFISEDGGAAGAASVAKPPALAEKLRALMGERREAGGGGNGEGWMGLRTGIVAGVRGVAEAVRRIDAVVREVSVAGPENAQPAAS
ncbi:MAG: mediator complex subunit [Thelocarpon impressellum]|nr:MAG: mediator complex subunit [Thelocarpon impressellum]